MRIDSHQHFWRHSAAEYPWIPVGTPLHRDWLPADLARIHAPLSFDGSIAVQARQSTAESDWLLGLADADPRVKGVVGWVDLRAPQAEADLERLAAHPRFVGVRHVAQDEPDDGFLARPGFVRGVGLLARFGLVYDLLVYERQLPAAIELVRQLPSQPFVLDHVAKPRIRAGELSPWRERIRELARHDNVVCKVSGMVTEADHAGWKPADLAPYLDVVLEAFGPRRLMFGSDWPVCLLAASYERVLATAEEFTRGWAKDDVDAFFGGTCAAFYGVG